MLFLWRGGLPPLEREAVLKSHSRYFYGCFARARTGRRGQAPSPQSQPASNQTPVAAEAAPANRTSGAAA